MRMWIDTEFNDFKGELLSMGIVAEDGNEFYEVIYKMPEGDSYWGDGTTYSSWVWANVVPVFNKRPVSEHDFKGNLYKFMSQYKEIHVIADWPEDLQHFMESLVTGPGKRINTPKITMELVYDLPSTKDISEIPHNALEDAKALRKAQLTREEV